MYIYIYTRIHNKNVGPNGSWILPHKGNPNEYLGASGISFRIQMLFEKYGKMTMNPYLFA